MLEKAESKGDWAIGAHRSVEEIAEGALNKKARIDALKIDGGRLEGQASGKSGIEGPGKRSGEERRARNGDKSQE
jgi:hypothetical protein